MRFMADEPDVLVSGRYLERGDQCIVNGIDDRDLLINAITPTNFNDSAGHGSIFTQ